LQIHVAATAPQVIAQLASAELERMSWMSPPGAPNIHGIKIAVNALFHTHHKAMLTLQATTPTDPLM
jgi:hypothetical protein